MSQSFEQFGKYILLEKLASGGMAEVFLAKASGANGINKFIAIKRILPQYSDNPDFIEMFKEEAKITVNLNHGNVVTVNEFGIEKSQFFLVMEYVEGRNLRQIINELKRRSSSFTIEQVVFIIKEVAAGLDHAHRCFDGSTGKPLNITHRDMSPQNVMVSFEGEVKVIDFGIAKSETQMEATKAGTLKGKFGYMSPEQADGVPIDLRTDIFSLGIVLWELLAVDRLFSASSEAAILRKIRDCQIPSIRKLNPSVPPELEKIVSKALSKDKTLRYQTAAQMHKDLNRFLNIAYPDFSPQDFSVFIKNTFSDNYAESKRKLVDYAKIQYMQQSENVEKSTVTQTMSFVVAADEDGESSADKSSRDFENPEGMVNSDFEHQTNLIVDLAGLKGEGKGSDTRKFSITSISENASNPFGKSHSGYSSAKTNSQIRKKTGRKSPLRKMNSEPTWLGIMVVAFLIISGSIYVTKSRNSNSTRTGTVEQPSKDPSVADTVQKSPVPPVELGEKNYAVVINSDPSGAKIYIDGKDINDTTPSRQKLPANMEFTLRLDKAGYFSHESTVNPVKDGYSVKVTLLQGRSGYLNLAVINGGANPIVEINGQRIVDKLPLEQYKIPASVPIRVKVSNPFSSLIAEKTIMVKENEKINVQMVLTREASQQ